MNKLLKFIVVFAAAVVPLLGFSQVLAQNTDDFSYYSSSTSIPNYDPGISIFASGVILVCECIFFLAVYIFMGLSIQKIAVKLGFEDKKVFAWIPILNIYLLVLCAKQEPWWTVLFFLPFVNIAVFAIVWMKVAKELNMPEWYGLLTLVPLVNFGIIAYMAFSGPKTAA